MDKRRQGIGGKATPIGPPAMAARLASVERDMTSHPERLSAFSTQEIEELEVLLEGVTVFDEETIPDDVTF